MNQAIFADMTTLRSLLEKEFAARQSAFEIPADRVPLASPTYGVDEIEAALETLLSSRVTMGEKVFAFEKQFAEYIGSKHAVMVNSGSSANLLAVSALMSPHMKNPLKPGDEVIVPAVTWPTTIFPLTQLGLKPVVVDADLKTFNMSPATIEAAITPKTKMVMIVPILGNPCDMEGIQALCKKHHLLLLEDTCESLGSNYNGKKCGTFGIGGTFSFFFSHHMTTIEGGMIATDDDQFADVLRSQRAHGWTRNHSKKKEIEAQYSNFDSRFLFIDTGFNFRATDLQASIGAIQLRKLPAMNDHRRELAKWILDGLAPFEKYVQLPVEQKNGFHTWFGFPFLVRAESGVKRAELMTFLESKGIETRPIVGGNLTLQPVFKQFEWGRSGDYKNANIIHENGIYFGTHPGMTKAHCAHIISAFKEFFASRN